MVLLHCTCMTISRKPTVVYLQATPRQCLLWTSGCIRYAKPHSAPLPPSSPRAWERISCWSMPLLDRNNMGDSVWEEEIDIQLLSQIHGFFQENCSSQCKEMNLAWQEVFWWEFVLGGNGTIYTPLNKSLFCFRNYASLPSYVSMKNNKQLVS